MIDGSLMNLFPERAIVTDTIVGKMEKALGGS
jgi:hypothetical protein